MRTQLATVSFSLFLAGCASTFEPANTGSVGNYTRPEIGAENIARIGDVLLTQGQGYEADCIIPSFDFQNSYGLGAVTVTIESGRPICENESEGLYIPTYQMISTISYDRYKGMIQITDKGDVTEFCAQLYYCFEKPSTSYLEDRRMVVIDDSLEQRIEYMGRRGDILDFTYAEFVNNMARQAFTREFSVDLNETKMLRFRGAGVDILDASQGELRYRVVSGFQ
jgi:hypothetical protein